MYSQQERCLYRRNALAQVICQLRFPEILVIGTQVPAEFQESIRTEFPLFSTRKERIAPKLAGSPGHYALEPQPPVINHQFTSEDGSQKINITSGFFSYTSTKYTCWENFARCMDKPLAAFLKIYQPAFLERIGLRYLNAFSRRELDLQTVPFSELFDSCYLGPLADEEVSERSMAQCSIDTDLAVRNGCRVKIHAGPGMFRINQIQDSEARFIFDMDLYMQGKTEVHLVPGALSTLHTQAFPIFRGAITDTLHQAMEPESVSPR